MAASKERILIVNDKDVARKVLYLTCPQKLA